MPRVSLGPRQQQPASFIGWVSEVWKPLSTLLFLGYFSTQGHYLLHFRPSPRTTTKHTFSCLSQHLVGGVEEGAELTEQMESVAPSPLRQDPHFQSRAHYGHRMYASMPVSSQLYNSCLGHARKTYLDDTMVSGWVALSTGDPRRCLGTCVAVLTRTWRGVGGGPGHCSGLCRAQGASLRAHPSVLEGGWLTSISI